MAPKVSLGRAISAFRIADGFHPVANPAVDADGNVFCTFSGSRGQKTPVSVFKIDPNYVSRPFITDLMNATGLASIPKACFISRAEARVRYINRPRPASVGLRRRHGHRHRLAFDREQNLYVGDRSGTVFKISPQRQIYVFATIEPSIAAYHLAFGPDDYLYVTGPTTSSFDCVHRVSPDGAVEIFYRGLDVRRAWRSTLKGGYTSQRLSQAEEAWCASTATGMPNCFFPDRTLLDSRFCPLARWL